MIRFEMQDGKIIDIKLFKNSAPISCANFEKLAREGFFDGTHFHRIIPGFVIQGGDPTGTGMGGSEENIRGEFKANGIDNPVSHKKGILSMARAGSYTSGFDTGSSQFFICLDDSCRALDGFYAAFGEVVQGIEAVDEIAQTPTDKKDYPVVVSDTVTIKKATVIDD